MSGFDAKRFMKTKWQPRTEDVPVPGLKGFFPEGENPVWKVRGLTGQEIGQANEAPDNFKTMAAAVEALAGAQAMKEKVSAIRDLLGLGGKTPADVAKRLEHLVLGSVDPPCTLDLAVKLCEAFPIEFFELTNKILRLTGLGQMPGKQPPSGEIPKSEPASPSDTPGGASSTS